MRKDEQDEEGHKEEMRGDKDITIATIVQSGYLMEVNLREV